MKKTRRVYGRAGFASGSELPAPGVTRWTPRRKAEVVAAVNGGLLTSEEACRRYSLAPEELTNWRDAYQRHGIGGLRTTREPRSQRRSI
jgi:transposase-like protein